MNFDLLNFNKIDLLLETELFFFVSKIVKDEQGVDFPEFITHEILQCLRINYFVIRLLNTRIT